MKRQNFLIFCIILFLFSGCTYYVFNRHPDLTKDLKAQESEVGGGPKNLNNVLSSDSA